MELAQAHRFTRSDYYRMLDTGILTEDSAVELIEGEVVTLSPQNHRHAYSITLLTGILVRAFGEGYHVRVQLPICIDEFTEPEPDLAVVTHRQLADAPEHPREAVLLVEIADSSLAYDRIKKSRIYARAAFPEYWVVNLPEQNLLVHRGPGPNGYQEMRTYTAQETVRPLLLPNTSLALSAFL